jgi:hypothetical protein
MLVFHLVTLSVAKPIHIVKREHVQRARAVRHSDFSEEYTGRQISINLADSRSLSGVLIESRRYWVKVKASNGGIAYINKSFIVSVVPTSN